MNAKESSKLSYAVVRTAKRCERVIEKFNDAMEDARLDNCMTDEKNKAILRDERGEYRFTPDGLRKVTEKRRELLDAEVELELYFATELPPDLSSDARVAFEGFVIRPEEVKEEAPA
jgi:hypothetical protein